MKSAAWWVLAVCLQCVTPLAQAQQGPVRIAGLVELSGTGATSGTNFNDGVKLAVKAVSYTHLTLPTIYSV